MAIRTAICNSFKRELLQGIHDFTNDVFKLALYTSSANLDETTTSYTTAGEVVGTNYPPGGRVVSGMTVTQSGNHILIDFDDVVFPNVTITVKGCLLYNSSKGNRAVAVWNFDSEKIVTASDFTVVVPAPTTTTAVIRLV